VQKFFIIKEYAGTNEKAVRSRTHNAGYGQSNLAISLSHNCHFTSTAIAFKFDHGRGECKNIYHTHNARATMGATIRYGGLFFIKYHK
jgi:hypothetical protein